MRLFPLLAAAVLIATLGAAAAQDRSALDGAVDATASQGFAGEVRATGPAGRSYVRAVEAPGRPHRAGELWRWASVSKQVTAVLVMQEVAAGRLSLDDTLDRRLPAFKGPTAGRVTLRRLLQHTSGLPNPDDTPAGAGGAPGFYLRDTPEVGGAADALGFCAGAPKAEPGAGFSYDNCDTIVLGAVLERATGRSFERLLRERITGPVRLASVRLARGGRPPPAPANGRGEDGGPEAPLVTATFGPAGALYGSAADLVAFDRALLDGRLLPPDARAESWRGDPKLGYVALGVWGFSAPLKGCAGGPVQLVERRGEVGGVEVRNLLAPALGRVLVVFADRAGFPFGELWQGRGFGYDLASAAFCT